MRNFWKYLTASILGTFIVLLFFIIVGIAGIISIATSSDSEPQIADHSVLLLNFEEPLSDRPDLQIDFASLSAAYTPGIRKITQSIKAAARDERIEGIVLSPGMLVAGMATVEEIRTALKEFKKSGKFIIAYADYYSQKSYYLSSVADKIYLMPEGILQFSGLSAQVAYFKSMLDKIGVEPEVIRYGKFKSAVEPFMGNEMSEANRQQISQYLNSLWGTMLSAISRNRNIPVDSLTKYADQLEVFTAGDALDKNLVDALKYKDELLKELKENKISSENFVKLATYAQVQKNDEENITHNHSIAVIYAEGSIVPGEGEDDEIGSKTLSEAIRKARKDKEVKAIVLRINSPGGSSLASEVIWRETVLAQKQKPFIVSMGDVAASGGYYIACCADTIVAEANTITGSIGVFALLFNAQELMKDAGVSIHAVNTNTYSDFGNPGRKMTSFERNVMQNSVNKTYETFVNRVSKGRKMNFEAVDKIGQGRVWTGKDAQNIGLVDVLGSLEDALHIAAKKAGLKDYGIKTFPEKTDKELLLESIVAGAQSRFIKKQLHQFYPYYQKVKELHSLQGMQARLPYFIDIE